jgi:hypothetical protein
MDLSLYLKCVCPSCFEEIYLGECRIVSGRTSGKVLKEPSKGLFARMNVEPLDGREYTLELAHRECPKCQYLLPPNIERTPTLTLVVVGDTFSGKSHYIAALIHQIKTDWMGNARLTCLTPEVEKTYTKQYFEPLFIKKQMLLPTPPAITTIAKPLIYKLAVSSSPKHPPMIANLMLYDASGEDFERQENLVQVARFVFNTTAFIFVADPFTIAPLLFRQLPSPLQKSLQEQFGASQGRRAAERLTAIVDLFERYRRDPEGSRLSNIPIAVMISKADLLKYLDLYHTYHFMRNPQYGGSLDLQDIDVVDQEVRELLRANKQGDLLSATSRFRQIKFFATSATGEAPDASGHFPHVEPCRCLDPMLWTLYCLGILKASV